MNKVYSELLTFFGVLEQLVVLKKKKRYFKAVMFPPTNQRQDWRSSHLASWSIFVANIDLLHQSCQQQTFKNYYWRTVFQSFFFRRQLHTNNWSEHKNLFKTPVKSIFISPVFVVSDFNWGFSRLEDEKKKLALEGCGTLFSMARVPLMTSQGDGWSGLWEKAVDLGGPKIPHRKGKCINSKILIQATNHERRRSCQDIY